MRKSLVALLLVGAAATLAIPAFAVVEEITTAGDFDGKLMNAQMAKELHTRVARLGTSTTIDPETTIVGYHPAYAGLNYWSVGEGDRNPPVPGAYWDWDHPVHGDSLQGWYPVHHLYTGTGGFTISDELRPWWAIETGNNVNYAPSVAGGRTFGVVGVWHVDPGNSVAPTVQIPADQNPPSPTWAPIEGAGSLWCGLRAHGDITAMDPVTGNAFSVAALEHIFPGPTLATALGTTRLYPGYASQWDQMAYHDFDLASWDSTDAFRVRFHYNTTMSTGVGSAAATRTGWFDKDPLTTFAGNYIQSTGNPTPPADSFMVYVGLPVEDGTDHPQYYGSDGLPYEVFDPQRRWFAEVVHANLNQYVELFTTYGDHANEVVDVSVVTDVLRDMSTEDADKVRLVLRLKTNRGFDDDNGSVGGSYTSGGAGAVQVDSLLVLRNNTVIKSSLFNDGSEIDNLTSSSAEVKWKTTGKPPRTWHHVHHISTLVFEDLCGPAWPVPSAARICDLAGVVVSMGDHENSEAAGGLYGTAQQEVFQGMFGPTVNLCVPAVGENEFGLDADTAVPTEDFYVLYNIYTGYFDLFNLGQGWQFGFQSYPAVDAAGTRCWGDFRVSSFQYFNPDKQCFDNIDAAKANGLIRTSNAGLQPDSIRLVMRKLQQCYRFGISTFCSPTDGGYWDNVSLCMIDGGAGAPLSVDIWQWIQDTFPANEDASLPGTASFDTCAAYIRGGLNVAQQTGSLLRMDIPGDTIVVIAEGDSVETQMVFRILPGPGNYATIGDPASGLTPVPTSRTPISVNDSSFWTAYILDPGKSGSPGGHPFDANHSKRWSPLVWNSARCDSAELNLFPVSIRNIGPGTQSGTFMNAYHEDDPKFGILGIARNVCFINDTLGSANDVNCGRLGDITTWGQYPPAWVLPYEELAQIPGATVAPPYVGSPLTYTGWDGSTTTKEATKIIPDGLLTPGAHVQYFFKRKDLGTSDVFVCPDSNQVFTQQLESSSDAHRWQQFSVMPDMWKRPAYGGVAECFMLYVDWNDRRGNERVWVSVADSVGATRSDKYGAHNGWHAPATGTAAVNDPANFVRDKNAQPGTTWDMYGIKAAESLNSGSGHLGTRNAYRDAGNPANKCDGAYNGEVGTGKYARNAPTIDMLEAYYSALVIMSGDLNSAILGPMNDRSGDDEGIISDFLLGADSTNYRAVIMTGDGIAEAEDGDPIMTTMGAALTDPSYRTLSGNVELCPDLTPHAPITTNGDIYGVGSTCLYTNDVLATNSAQAVVGSEYENFGINGPYPSGVYQNADPGNSQYYVTLLDGFEVEHLWGRFCDRTGGRLAYFYNLLKNVSDVLSCVTPLQGPPNFTLEVPNNPTGKPFVDFMRLRNNPVITGSAKIDFGLAKKDRVEIKVYDVSGRLIRTLADGRMFDAGDHSITWDGSDNGGSRVARGVYFTQVKFLGSKFASARKVTFLR
jgi:hypothetical protein